MPSGLDEIEKIRNVTERIRELERLVLALEDQCSRYVDALMYYAVQKDVSGDHARRALGVRNYDDIKDYF